MRQLIMEAVTTSIKSNWGKDKFFELVTDDLIKAGIVMELNNQVGQTFGNWKVLESLGKIGTHQYYKCECGICGQIKNVALSNLISGKSKNCANCKSSKIEAKIANELNKILYPDVDYLASLNLTRILKGEKEIDKYGKEIEELA